jgi:hypothetical protein
VVDTADKCPTEAESVNGVDDFDGCDDGGGAQLARLDGDRLVLDRQPGFDRKGLNRAGEVILDQAALVMLQSRDVTQWVVAVAAKSKGEAERQAGWVRARLTSRGLPAKSIQVLASAGDPQVGILARERAEVDAAKAVCPAGERRDQGAPRAGRRGSGHAGEAGARQAGAEEAGGARRHRRPEVAVVRVPDIRAGTTKGPPTGGPFRVRRSAVSGSAAGSAAGTGGGRGSPSGTSA